MGRVIRYTVYKRKNERTVKYSDIIIWISTLSILLTTQEALVDSQDQDQTAQNVQSDL